MNANGELTRPDTGRVAFSPLHYILTRAVSNVLSIIKTIKFSNLCINSIIVMTMRPVYSCITLYICSIVGFNLDSRCVMMIYEDVIC